MEDIFNSKEKSEQAISSFKTLLDHPGWLLVTGILNANIDVVREQLEFGTGDGETKDTVDRLRDKLRIYREIRDTPKNMIKRLETPKEIEVTDDPFETVEELKKSRMEEVELKT